MFDDPDQEIPDSPEFEEAPDFDSRESTELIGTELGATRVDLLLQGTWRTGAHASFGLARAPLGADLPGLTPGRFVPAPFPGFRPPGIFNEVDLTLSVEVDERYYVDTVFANELVPASLMFGYRGDEGEPIESVRLGYGDIGTDEYPHLPTAQARDNVFGADASFRTGEARHQAMARFEPTAPARRTYIGTRELLQDRIPPETYRSDMAFVLPDEDVSGVHLYREAADRLEGSDGRRYHRLRSGRDFRLNAAQGIVELFEPPDGRVLIYYQAAGETGTRSVGDPELGRDALYGIAGVDSELPAGALDPRERLDFSFTMHDDGDRAREYLVRIDRADSEAEADARAAFAVELTDPEAENGSTDDDEIEALVLHDPGYFSPFAKAGRYRIDPDVLPAEESPAYLRRGADTSAPEIGDPPADIDRDRDLLRIMAGSPRSFERRYPFATAYPELYGPRARREPGTADFEIVRQALGPEGKLRVDQDHIPGSVRMTRNGRPERRFTVDEASGVVSPAFDPDPSDRIVLEYRTFDEGASVGDLVFGGGYDVPLGDNFRLRGGIGARWDLTPGGFSTEPEQHPGELSAGARLEYERDDASAYVSVGSRAAIADTTGELRLFGLDRGGRALDIVAPRALPGARPRPFTAPPLESESSSGGAGSQPGEDGEEVDLETAPRGKLFFADYRANGAYTPYTEPPERRYDYADGKPIGPYLVGRPDKDGRMLALEYELDPASNDGDAGNTWVAGQLQLRPDELPEQPKGLRFSWLQDGGSTESAPHGNVAVYLQIGAVAEDLDGDGDLDEGTDARSPQFPFVDSERDITLYAGGRGTSERTGPGATEDGTRTGTLLPEDPRRLVTRRIDRNGGDPEEEESSVTIRFSEREQALLSEARAVRIVVVSDDPDTSSGPPAGRFLFGDFELLGSRLRADGLGGARVQADEVPERDVRDADGDPPPAPLAEAFADADRLEPIERQRVLAVSFRADEAGTGSVSADDRSGDRPDAGIPAARIAGSHASVPLSTYGVLELLLHTGDSGDATLEISAASPDGEPAIEARMPVSERAEWQRIELDLARETVHVNGERVDEAELHVDRGESARRLNLTFTPERDGAFYIGPPAYRDSSPTLDGSIAAGFSYRIPGTVLSAGDVSFLADPALSLDAEISGSTTHGFERAVLDATAEAEFLSSFLSLSGDVTTRPERGPAGSFGHELRIPAERDPIRLVDRYRRSFEAMPERASRLSAVEAEVDGVGSARLASKARLHDRKLDQEWMLEAESGAAAVDARLELLQRSDGFALPEAGYPGSWLDGFRLLSPWEEEEAEERGAGGRARYQSASGSVRPSVELTSSYRSEPRSHLFRAGHTAATGIEFQLGDVTVEPRYRREANLTTETGGGDRDGPQASNESESSDGHGGPDSHRADLRTYGSSLVHTRAFWQSVPAWELIVPLEGSTFAQTVPDSRSFTYRPAFSLEARRPFGSRLRDLVVPVRGSTTIERRFRSEYGEPSAHHRISGNVAMRALNLFGELGAYTLTELYRQDEFQSELSGDITLTGNTPQWRLALAHEAGFFADEGRELGVAHTLSFFREESPKTTSVSELFYSLRHDADWAGVLPIDFEVASVSHTPRITLDLARTPGEPWERRIIGGYRARLDLDDFAQVDADLQLGWQREPTTVAESTAFVDYVGIEASLSGQLRF